MARQGRGQAGGEARPQRRGQEAQQRQGKKPDAAFKAEHRNPGVNGVVARQSRILRDDGGVVRRSRILRDDGGVACRSRNHRDDGDVARQAASSVTTAAWQTN
jgi:hypothetical protein